MVQYYTDFSEYDTGTTPSDWTKESTQDPEDGTWEITSNGELEGSSSSGVQFFTWDGIDSDDMEIVCRTQFLNFDFGGAVVRVDSNSPQAYTTRLSQTFDAYQIREFDEAGASSAIASGDAPDTGWVWIRFRAEGDVFYSKIWPDGAEEPAEWALDATSDSFSFPVGGILVGAGDDVLFTDVGVGTEGDSAPTEPTAVTNTELDLSASDTDASSVVLSEKQSEPEPIDEAEDLVSITLEADGTFSDTLIWNESEEGLWEASIQSDDGEDVQTFTTDPAEDEIEATLQSDESFSGTLVWAESELGQWELAVKSQDSGDTSTVTIDDVDAPLPPKNLTVNII